MRGRGDGKNGSGDEKRGSDNGKNGSGDEKRGSGEGQNGIVHRVNDEGVSQGAVSKDWSKRRPEELERERGSARGQERKSGGETEKK